VVTAKSEEAGAGPVSVLSWTVLDCSSDLHASDTLRESELRVTHTPVYRNQPYDEAVFL